MPIAEPQIWPAAPSGNFLLHCLSYYIIFSSLFQMIWHPFPNYSFPPNISFFRTLLPGAKDENLYKNQIDFIERIANCSFIHTKNSKKRGLILFFCCFSYE
jgi:hypothetical protein